MDHAARREDDRRKIQGWIDQGLVKTPAEVARRLGVTRQAVVARNLGLVYPGKAEQALEERIHLGLSPVMLRRLDAVRSGQTRQEFVRSALVAALDARQGGAGSECAGCAAGDFSCRVCGREYAVAEEKLEFVISAEETSLRWFGPTRPRRQSPEGEVTTPVGSRCAACSQLIMLGAQGWTVPALGSEVRSSYHHECLMKAVGLPER